MPLEFRSREEEGFSIRRFLKTVGIGVGVFLLFMAFGYYVVGPRLTVSEEGRLQLRLVSRSEEKNNASPDAKPLPKVEVYEKLSPDVTAGTGLIIGSREVAPFDYERYQQKRRERNRKQAAETSPDAEVTSPPEDEYFVPDESATEPTSPAPETPAEPPAEPPATPVPETPAPAPEPTKPTPETPETALYRVQIGVYESRDNANQVAQSLLASGFEATIVPFQRDGRTMYRVQSLVTRDREKADSLKRQLEDKGFSAVVVKVQ